MYSLPTVIWVACEGKSEKACLAELNRLFRETGTPIILKDEVAGGGFYPLAEAAYKRAQKKSGTRGQHAGQGTPWVWVDSDLYERNDRASGDLYTSRPKGIPAFLFSHHNFEDFLVLHLGDEQVEQWRQLCHGGTAPLHERDYLPLLASLFPDYAKPSLPAPLSPLPPRQRLPPFQGRTNSLPLRLHRKTRSPHSLQEFRHLMGGSYLITKLDEMENSNLQQSINFIYPCLKVNI